MVLVRLLQFFNEFPNWIHVRLTFTVTEQSFGEGQSFCAGATAKQGPAILLD